VQQQQCIKRNHLHTIPNHTLNMARKHLVPQGPISTTYLHLGLMRELPLLAPQWLQSDPWGRGSHSPLPNCNHGSPCSQQQREVEIPKHEDQAIRRHVHDQACGYSNRSNNFAERVHLYPTRNGTRRWSANWAHPTMQTLGSYGPILHSNLKAIPPQWGLHRNY
jgi:hypothetical protein